MQSNQSQDVDPFGPLALRSKHPDSIVQPIARTLHEGGAWIPEPLWQLVHSDKSCAAEMYVDGSIYDHIIADKFPEHSPLRWFDGRK
jgi:hypothetical protein